jgi:hypothetical protein
MDLEGKVQLGIKTLAALFVVVIGAVITLMSTWSTLPTKTDLREMFQEHTVRVDAHPVMHETLEGVKDAAVAASSRIESLENQQTETKESVEYIRARIDFLTEQTIREAVARTQPRQVEEAVERVRAGADPQKTLDGL